MSVVINVNSNVVDDNHVYKIYGVLVAVCNEMTHHNGNLMSDVGAVIREKLFTPSNQNGTLTDRKFLAFEKDAKLYREKATHFCLRDYPSGVTYGGTKRVVEVEGSEEIEYITHDLSLMHLMRSVLKLRYIIACYSWHKIHDATKDLRDKNVVNSDELKNLNNAESAKQRWEDEICYCLYNLAISVFYDPQKPNKSKGFRYLQDLLSVEPNHVQAKQLLHGRSNAIKNFFTRNFRTLKEGKPPKKPENLFNVEFLQDMTRKRFNNTIQQHIFTWFRDTISQSIAIVPVLDICGCGDKCYTGFFKHLGCIANHREETQGEGEDDKEKRSFKYEVNNPTRGENLSYLHYEINVKLIRIRDIFFKLAKEIFSDDEDLIDEINEFEKKEKKSFEGKHRDVLSEIDKRLKELSDGDWQRQVLIEERRETAWNAGVGPGIKHEITNNRVVGFLSSLWVKN